MAKITQSDGPLIENDQAFQCRMWTVQRYGWVIIALIVITALLGLFGSGPLSTVRVGTPSAALQLRYDRFVRSQAPTDLYITLSAPTAGSDKVQLWVNRSYVEHIEMQRITPMPIEVATSNAGLSYTFRVEDQTQAVTVIFTLQPIGFGSLSGLLRNGTGETVRFHQLVYP